MEVPRIALCNGKRERERENCRFLFLIGYMVITHPTNETYLYVGLEFDTVSDVKDCWNQIQATGFDFISIPLANERRGCRQVRRLSPSCRVDIHIYIYSYRTTKIMDSPKISYSNLVFLPIWNLLEIFGALQC